jgi:hypothetical protein
MGKNFLNSRCSIIQISFANELQILLRELKFVASHLLNCLYVLCMYVLCNTTIIAGTNYSVGFAKSFGGLDFKMYLHQVLG